MTSRTANNARVRDWGIDQNTEVDSDTYSGTIYERELLMWGDDGLLDQAAPGESNAVFGGVSESGSGTSGGAVSSSGDKLKVQLWGFYLAAVESSDANADTAEAFKLEDGGSSPTLAATHRGRLVYATDSRTLDIDPDDTTAPLAGFIFRVLATGGNGSGRAMVYLDAHWAAGVLQSGGANPLAAFTRPVNPILVDGAIDTGSRHVFTERFLNKPILNNDSPGSVAALTAASISVLGGGTPTQVVPDFVGTATVRTITASFKDEINKLVTDVTAIRTALINGHLANKAWEIAGTAATTALCTFAVDGGVTLTTATSANDQEIIRAHQDTAQSALETIEWATASKIRMRAVLALGATITSMIAAVGFKITETTLDVATDADQAYLKFDTGGAVSTANWTSVDSASNTDNEQNTGVAAVAATDIEVVIDVDEDRIPRYYINGDLVATGNALTSVTTLKPFVGVQTLTNAARAITVRSLSLSVGH